MRFQQVSCLVLISLSIAEHKTDNIKLKLSGNPAILPGSARLIVMTGGFTSRGLINLRFGNSPPRKIKLVLNLNY